MCILNNLSHMTKMATMPIYGKNPSNIFFSETNKWILMKLWREASMDRILISLKKENGPRALAAPALGLNTIIFKHVYWYMQQTQVSVYRTIGPLVFWFTDLFGKSLDTKEEIKDTKLLNLSKILMARFFLFLAMP